MRGIRCLLSTHTLMLCVGFGTFTQLASPCSAQSFFATPAYVYCSEGQASWVTSPNYVTTFCPDGYVSGILMEAADGSMRQGTLFSSPTPSALRLPGQKYVFGTEPFSGISNAGMQLTEPGDIKIQDLVQGPAGDLWGTIAEGGDWGTGEVIKVSPGGSQTVVHQFAQDQSEGNDVIPFLTLGQDGSFYGMTLGGGANGWGTIFKISTSGVLSVLVNLPAAFRDYFAYGPAGSTSMGGGNTTAGLVQATDGNFYGVLTSDDSYGSIYQFSPQNNQLQIVYTFTGGTDGAYPQSGLVEGPDGGLYGTTADGGKNSLCKWSNNNGGTSAGCGVVFAVYPEGLGKVKMRTLAAFDETYYWPAGPPMFAGDGNLYGATNSGNILYRGNFQTGIEKVWENCTAAASSNCSLFNIGSMILQGSDGTLYTSSSALLSLSPPSFDSSPLQPPIQIDYRGEGSVGQQIRISFVSLNSFSLTMQQCYAFATNESTGIMYVLGKISSTFANGKLSGAFEATPTVGGNYLIAVTCGGRETGLALLKVSSSQSASYATPLTLIASPPAATGGEIVTLTARQTYISSDSTSDGIPVAFTYNGIYLGSATMQSGIANLSISTDQVPFGYYPVTASAGSPASSATTYVGSAPIKSLVAVTVWPSSISYGQSLTVTVNVTNPVENLYVSPSPVFSTPSGSVSLYGKNPSVPIITSPVVNGLVNIVLNPQQIAALPVQNGMTQLSVNYNGDATHLPNLYNAVAFQVQ